MLANCLANGNEEAFAYLCLALSFGEIALTVDVRSEQLKDHVRDERKFAHEHQRFAVRYADQNAKPKEKKLSTPKPKDNKDQNNKDQDKKDQKDQNSGKQGDPKSGQGDKGDSKGSKGNQSKGSNGQKEQNKPGQGGGSGESESEGKLSNQMVERTLDKLAKKEGETKRNMMGAGGGGRSAKSGKDW